MNQTLNPLVRGDSTVSETKTFETVRLEFDDGITTLSLDRPEKKNAINPTMIEEMYNEVMPRIQQDAKDPEGGTNVLIVTGSGDAFCGGMDLNEFFLANADQPARMARIGQMNKSWFQDLYRFPRPTIAAVNGWCFGGGLGVLGATDLAIAANDAIIGLSEVRWGILPAGGATYLPAQTISRRDFLEMSLMGREIDGERADEIRLVNKSVAGDELDGEVRAWAEELNDLNPHVVSFAKQAYYTEMENCMDFEAAWDYEIARNRQLRGITEGEDVKALQAFRDKKFKPGVETYTDDDIAEYED